MFALALRVGMTRLALRSILEWSMFAEKGERELPSLVDDRLTVTGMSRFRKASGTTSAPGAGWARSHPRCPVALLTRPPLRRSRHSR